MLLPCQFLVPLMSVATMVDSSPQRTGPCHQGPGKTPDQDTIFPKCDYGIGGTLSESIGVNSRIGSGNSNSDSGSSSDDGGAYLYDDSEGSNTTTSSTTENYSESVSHQTTTNQHNTTPSVSNVAVSGRNPGCTARPDPGECRGAFPRFYFNPDNDQCDCFLFGGCDEEGVVFTWLTLTECHEACVPTNKEQGPGCQRITLDEVMRFLDSPENPVDDSTKKPINNSINEIPGRAP